MYFAFLLNCKCNCSLFSNFLIRLHEQMIWNDLKDRLKRFYERRRAVKKMKLIHKYYTRMPPVNPNYWILDQKDMMLSNIEKKKAIFMIKSRMKNSKYSLTDENSSGNPASPRKTEKMFTSAFYEQLNAKNRSMSSKNINGKQASIIRWTDFLLAFNFFS